MIKLILITYLIIPVALQAQENKKIMMLKPNEFASFPKDFQVTQKVFEHYYNIGFLKKQIDSLNDGQKTLCYHFICDGLIDNAGFYSILLETKGEFNIGYSAALHHIKDSVSKRIFDEIVSLYNKYEKWLSNGNVPPELNDGSKEFDKIKELEKKWYANGVVRNKLFEEYLQKHKLEIVGSY